MTDFGGVVEMLVHHYDQISEHGLESVRKVLTAGRDAVNAAEAGILVPADDGANLRFLVSVNSRPEIPALLADLLVPCNKSIAGMVFATGQPLAFANPTDIYAEVDQKTGLKTEMYMAVPIMDEHGVLGVATFLNRPEGQQQEPFTQPEIEAAGQFGTLCGVAIRNYHRACTLERLFVGELNFTIERELPGVELVAADEGRGDDSGMVQALLDLEAMPEHQQNLAADIINLLREHLGDSIE